MESTAKNLFYRRAEFLNPNSGATLQTCINQAIGKRATASQRTENVAQSVDQLGSWSRFINTHLSAHGMEFGVFMSLEPGAYKLLVKESRSKDELDVSQLSPPKGSQFAESFLYYGIKDDHVILLQSTSLRAKQFEQYLFWFLGPQCSSIISKENGLFLNNYAPQDTYRAVSKSPVKDVRIHTPLGDDNATLVEVDTGTSISADNKKIEIKSTKFEAGSYGIAVLKALFPEDRLNKILEDVRAGGGMDLEVMVEVKRRRYVRQFAEDSQLLLNKIASTMRYTDSTDLKISLDDGTTLTGDKLTIKVTKDFDSHNGILRSVRNQC